jgi:hypothetical protein
MLRVKTTRLEITWEKWKPRAWAELMKGTVCCANIKDWKARLWGCIQLTQAETAFTSWRSKLRPIASEKSELNILVCFMAYVLWKMLGQMCKRASLGDEPRQVLDEISQIKVVDVIMSTKQGTKITQCCISQPTISQAILL